MAVIEHPTYNALRALYKALDAVGRVRADAETARRAYVDNPPGLPVDEHNTRLLKLTSHVDQAQRAESRLQGIVVDIGRMHIGYIEEER